MALLACKSPTSVVALIEKSSEPSIRCRVNWTGQMSAKIPQGGKSGCLCILAFGRAKLGAALSTVESDHPNPNSIQMHLSHASKNLSILRNALRHFKSKPKPGAAESAGEELLEAARVTWPSADRAFEAEKKQVGLCNIT